MYNYQTYLKENKLQKKFDQIRKEYYEDIQKNQSTDLFLLTESNPSLIHSHKKRIEGFILAMIEKPNPVRVYEDQHYEPRSPEKSHSIHERSFHLNHTTDKERIEVLFCQIEGSVGEKFSLRCRAIQQHIQSSVQRFG